MKKFKKEFIKSLTLPEKLNDIEITDNIKGGVRLNNNIIDSVYIQNVKSKKFKNTHIILKFKYIESEFLFNRIYLCEDGFNDIGYNKDLEIVTKDLVLYNRSNDFSVPIYGKPIYDDKDHVNSIIKEWKIINRHLESNDYEEGFIPAYKIEKNGEKVKVPYIFSNKKSKIPIIKDLDKILVNPNPKSGFTYGCKCTVNGTEIIKDINNIYIKAND
jgi:hypothetical protein